MNELNFNNHKLHNNNSALCPLSYALFCWFYSTILVINGIIRIQNIQIIDQKVRRAEPNMIPSLDF